MNEKDNPSIVVVGNCLVTSFATTLKLLNPSVDVQPWHLGEWPVGEPEDILPTLSAFDFLIISLPHSMLTGVLDLDELRKIVPNVLHVPPFVFSGFHPDCVTLLDRNTNQIVPSPYRQHHSQIVAASFALGLSEKRVSRLFNTFVFDSLGYFDAYNIASKYLCEQFHSSGIELDDYLYKWLRELGTFMWIPIHPRIEVFLDISNILLGKMGLPSNFGNFPKSPVDTLEKDLQFPVFPELAKKLGVSGSTVILQSANHVAIGDKREADMSDWISMLYSFYRNADISNMETMIPTWVIEKLDSILVKN